MKEITKLIVNSYRIKKLGYDFMGYTFVSPTDLSYHHLLEKSDGGEESLENGVALVRKTSHDYLHIIEKYDKEIFKRITEEIVKEKDKGFIDIENIKIINNLLLLFESKHSDDTFKNGKLILRDSYKKRILTMKNL